MDIRYKDILKLSDGNEYVVTSMASYEDNQYYYVVNINDISIVKFLKLITDNNEFFLEEIMDDSLISEIMPVLLSNIKEELEK